MGVMCIVRYCLWLNSMGKLSESLPEIVWLVQQDRCVLPMSSYTIQVRVQSCGMVDRPVAYTFRSFSAVLTP
jgi:hypothetical protein